jgi:hypothetical protein
MWSAGVATAETFSAEALQLKLFSSVQLGDSVCFVFLDKNSPHVAEYHSQHLRPERPGGRAE